MKKNSLFVVVMLLSIVLTGCAPCSTCEGEGIIDCPECEDGKEVCYYCSGEGIRYSKKCTSCDGDGSKAIDCQQCEGSGYIVNPFTWQKFDCGRCGGKMYEIVDCKYCDGEGRIEVKEGITCENCQSGYIACIECEGKLSIDCPNCEKQ